MAVHSKVMSFLVGLRPVLDHGQLPFGPPMFWGHSSGSGGREDPGGCSARRSDVRFDSWFISSSPANLVLTPGTFSLRCDAEGVHIALRCSFGLT